MRPGGSGTGTTGFQWWPTDWHYFVMPESLKEAFRSDGTPFAVVSDANISAGALLVNGQPKYPIVLSFDDGDITHALNAAPVLLKAHWPGVLNLAVNLRCAARSPGFPRWAADRSPGRSPSPRAGSG